ncbi:MAG: hypothetical protein HQ503_15890, partial [Rhodospirillales bacterium]|nr:hypothetical protein [Rhodospirillales bacterium]
MRRHRNWQPLVLGFGFAAALMGPLAAGAVEKRPTEVGRRLQDVEKEIQEGRKKSKQLDEKADVLRRRLGRVNHQKVTLAGEIQGLEIEMTELEREIGQLNGAEIEKNLLLSSRKKQSSRLLMALQKMSRMPPEAVIAYPEEPANLVRTAILLRATLPRIESQAARLREDLIALNMTRAEIAKRRVKLSAAAVGIGDRRRQLESIISKTGAARRQTLAARQVESTRIKSLTDEAGTLRDLFRKLETERIIRENKSKKSSKKQKVASNRPSQPLNLTPKSAVTAVASFEIREFTRARGALIFPVVGQIKNVFGEKIRQGIRHKGITVATRAGAQVVAPYDGKVVFAGIFRGYG